MSKREVWIVECRDESNHATGERNGPWYPCGYESHRMRKDALIEARNLGGPGPFRAIRYIPAPARKKKVKRK